MARWASRARRDRGLSTDRTTKRLQPCTSQLCAFQEYGNVNRPNFMGGGAQIMLRKGTSNRAAALSFAAYFSTHVDVRSPGSNNPFRSSHYDPVEYTKSRPVAWDYDDAKLYTAALYDTLNRDTTATLPATKNADIIATLLASAAEEYIRLAQYENYTTNATEILARTQTDILQQGEANACGVDVVDRNIRIHLDLPLRSVAGKSSNTATTSLAIIVPLVVLSAAVAVAYVKLRPHWAARRGPEGRGQAVRHHVCGVEVRDRSMGALPNFHAQDRRGVLRGHPQVLRGEWGATK